MTASAARPERRGQDTAAMAAASTGYAFVPLLIHLSGGSQYPLTVNAVLSAGLVAANVPYLLIFHRKTVAHPSYRNAVWTMATSPLIAVMVLTNFELAAYALATRFVDISIAAVLYESWPLILVIYTAWLYRGQHRYQALRTGTIGLMLAGATATALVVTSQHGTLAGLDQSQGVHLLAGVGLGLASAILSSGAAASLKWGTILAQRLADQKAPAGNRTATEVMGGCTASLLANAVIIPLNLGLGLATGEHMPVRNLLMATAGAALCHGVPTVLWRYGNYMTTNLALNALSYASPAIGIGVLFAAGAVAVKRPDLLIAGTAAIIAVNILIARTTHRR